MLDEQKTETTTMSNKKGNILLGSGLAVTLAAAAFFSGLHLGGTERFGGDNMSASLFGIFGAQPSQAESVDMTEFWQVWNLLDEKFVTSSSSTSPTAEEKIQGAISGLVGSYGDPYTVYMPPEDAKQFDQDISGNFSGVGMEVGMRNNLITVIAPLPDTPADKAGILAGDVIVEIDGTSTKGMSIDEAVRLIRGEKGTQVKLQLYRQGASDFITVDVTRDTITIPTIKTEMKGDTFVVALYSFNAIAEQKMEEAMREYLKSGADSLILDLRGNPGGYLQGAVSIASYFLPTGNVVVRESFGDGREEQVYRSHGKVIADFNPDNFVILVNGGSASAAEILSGALKEHHVATLIGEQTFGKGSVQELIPLKKDGSLKVTIARWLTPDGTSISDGGLAPNVVIPRSADQIIAGEDTQLDAALEWIGGKRDFETATSSVDALKEKVSE